MGGATKVVKGGLLGVVLLTLIAWGVWGAFFKVTNEIGPLGADKVGRQIMIQSLDHHFQKANQDISVDSDFFDHNILSRLIQEPMRTTFRFTIGPKANDLTIQLAREWLEQPYNLFLREYTGRVTLQDSLEMTPPEIDGKLRELGTETMGDYLSAWGFRIFEVYQGERLVLATKLKIIGRPNIKHIGE